jgi:para-nitrobenzyl esterase
MGAASHVMELFFVFGTLNTPDVADMMRVPGTDDEIRLSQAMMTAWSSFARCGDPNHAGLPEWPLYEPEHRRTMFLDLHPRIVDLPFDAIRSAWTGIVDTCIYGPDNSHITR